MTAETLGVALVVLVGASVLGMVRDFLRKPWYLQESMIVVETPEPITYMERPAVAYATPRSLPANVYAIVATARPLGQPPWLDATEEIRPLQPETIPA